jgi:hypothetical protein
MLLAVTAACADGTRPAATSCRPFRATAGYVRSVEQATAAGQDLWGNELIRTSPSYQAAGRYLKPLLLAGGPLQSGPLTDSGVYYLAFGRPDAADGRGPIALHLADGSELVSDRFTGPRLALDVGADGQERYGSCLARLSTPRLYGGYYPILETEYVDGNGARFRQESFVARVPSTGTLASFVRLDVEMPKGSTAEKIRFTPAGGGDGIPLSFSEGGRFTGSSLEYDVDGSRAILVARPIRPVPAKSATLDERAYEQARRSVIAYWDHRLSGGATFVVPEQRVVDAERSLLIQNLLLNWRYSLGNAYEAFEFPESLENATVLGEYGFGAEDRAIVEESFRREPHLYPNWEAATRLLAAARYFRLLADRSFATAAMPDLRRNAALLEGEHGLLRKERTRRTCPTSPTGSRHRRWRGRGSAGSPASGPRRGAATSLPRAGSPPPGSTRAFAPP